MSPTIRTRLALSLLAAALVTAATPMSVRARQPEEPDPFEEAQRMLYNGDYRGAYTLTRGSCSPPDIDLVACELQTSALHFAIRKALGGVEGKSGDLKACAECAALLTTFKSEMAQGLAHARAQAAKAPTDDTTLFLLGKINLNHVWLHLGTLGKKTGWSEYWEGRRSLDQVLKLNPKHVRARVARAWIDYIVDTRMPRGTRWLLGGGDKKRGMATVRAAAAADAEFFARTEAMFALWDMQVRERQFAEAVVVARQLQRDFPANEELRKFLLANDRSSTP